ncbi:MAG: ABC transporter substrate-binding protein [Desulfurococcales archaeon]|nr:ABC transporter substrate-binding protein [Desulfurococcales archaeon]
MAAQNRALLLVGVIAAFILIALALFFLGGGSESGEVGTQAETPPTPQTTPQPTAGETVTEAITTTTETPETRTTVTTPEEKEIKREPVILRVLTRHPGEIQRATVEAFLQSEVAKKYNIVDIKFYSVPPVAWISAIKSRGDFDVAWGGGPTLFDQLYLEGLLAPLTSEEALDAASQIPDKFAGVAMKRVGDDGKIYWVAASIASFGFTVNHKVLKEYNLPIPKRWADLASPLYGKPLVEENRPIVAIADPTKSTSNTRMYEIILQAYGWEEGWKVLTGMAANSLIEQGSADVRDDVIVGKVAVGITIDFYGYTAMRANPDTEYIIPEGETVVNGDPIALLVTSKNPDAAQAFIAWVLTEGQKIWFREDVNRLPANPNAFNLPEGRERQDLKAVWESLRNAKTLDFDDNLALQVEVAMQLYFNATLVQLDNLLKEVWKALVSKYLSGEISDDEFKAYLSRLGEPLEYVDPVTGEKVKFTMEDAKRVTEVLRENPRLRDAYIAAWRKAAVEKYESLLAELGG